MTPDELLEQLRMDPWAKLERMPFWRMYDHDPDVYDEQATDDLRTGACVRCGDCCRAVPCRPAQRRGAQPRTRCPYLQGDRAGEYSCVLLLVGDQAAVAELGPGAGCTEPHGVDRLGAAARQAELRRGGK